MSPARIGPLLALAGSGLIRPLADAGTAAAARDGPVRCRRLTRSRPGGPPPTQIRSASRSPTWCRGCGALCGGPHEPPAARAHCRAGCRWPSLSCLSCLAGNPGARPGQLARLLRLAPSSVATLVNGLRRTGLVSRTGGQLDRRTASLLLTPDGTATVVRWREINERILQSAITRLAPASRDALGAALPGLRELTGAVDALADEPQAGDPGRQNGTTGQR